METIVSAEETKTHLSELLRRVDAGETVAIARAGHVFARLEPVTTRGRLFESPLLPGVPVMDVTQLLAPLSEDELSDWEQTPAGEPLATPH